MENGASILLVLFFYMDICNIDQDVVQQDVERAVQFNPDHNRFVEQDILKKLMSNEIDLDH